MTDRISRRSALRNLTAGSATVAAASFSHTSMADTPTLRGNINHSVCKWCYRGISLDDFCKAVKNMGITSVDLMGPNEWPTLKKHGLTCAMTNGAGMGIGRGFNDPKLHDDLVADYESLIPKVAEAGYENLICFSGNRRDGLSEEEGIENCAKGLKRLMDSCEKHKVTLVMELLNSKRSHKGYQCDRTPWGVELCKQIGSERFKLLYDVFHMQIMEGDIIDTIKEYAPYIAHYHTGGVPGRSDIDASQEIYYPAVMRAIVATGFKGHVAQEFIPKNPNPPQSLESLRKAIEICDV